MISWLLGILASFVVNFISLTSYGGVFVLMFLESCGIPIPSEITMPFAGFLVSEGRLSFWPVVLAGTLGNVAGSLLAYWIGAKGGRPLLERYGKYFLISHHDLDLADRWFQKYGKAAAFVGRLLPVVRTYISFPAGIARMNIKEFLAYTFFGTLLWSVLFAWLGVKTGAHWERIREMIHGLDSLIAVMILAALVWYVWLHIERRRSNVRTP